MGNPPCRNDLVDSLSDGNILTMFDKLLVLDLDETLIHARDLRHDSSFETSAPGDFEMHGFFEVRRRPGLDVFLSSVFSNFAHVGIWTSATLSYAVPIIREITDIKNLDFVWGRNRCTYWRDLETHETEWLKDIKKLKRRGYRKEKILYVDDTPGKIRRSWGNYIRIPPFTGSLEDRELFHLLEFLLKIGNVPNVRNIELRTWRSHRVLNRD